LRTTDWKKLVDGNPAWQAVSIPGKVDFINVPSLKPMVFLLKN
jgi:hypothetical protein